MKSPLVTSAAVIAALLVVLSTRLVVPALQVIYYSILKTFEPIEPDTPALASVTVTEPVVKPVDEVKPAPKKRATKSSTTSTKRTTRKRVASTTKLVGAVG